MINQKLFILFSICIFCLGSNRILAEANIYNDSANRGYCINTGGLGVKELFSANGVNFPVASAVRGGVFPDWIPEMSISSFEKSIELAPAIIEVRPNISSDGVIFLLPDLTLDRTTTGNGLAHIMSWNELSNLSLLDNAGRITGESMPTLEDALDWAKDKTILQLNMFNEFIGVTPDLSAAVIDLIEELDAENQVMMISWSNQQAKAIYDLNNNLPVAIFSLFPGGIEDAESLGVPTENIVPTLSFDIDNDYIYYLQNRGLSPAYITYFLESSDLRSGQARRIYQNLYNEGIVLQATTRLKDFGEAFNFSSVDSPYLTRGCLGEPQGPMCFGKVATIVGTNNFDVIVGTQDDDVIVALGGDDIITGGKGNDIICAGAGNDIIYSGKGRDIIFGEAGNDLLYGGERNDFIVGGDDFDIVDGGNGRHDRCFDSEQLRNCE